jgi:hypothetical protein
MTQIKLIGNERKENEDLIEKAILNSMIREILEGKSFNTIIYLNDDYIAKAKQLHENIETYFPKDENGLVRFFKEEDSKPTIESNALFAVDKFLLGYNEDALDLYKKIVTTVEHVETGLINAYKESSANTGDNLGFVMLMFFMSKNRKVGERLFERVSGKGLYDLNYNFFKESFKKEHISLSDNSLATILYSLFDMHHVSHPDIEHIENQFKFNKETGLFRHYLNSANEYYAHSNLFYAVAKYLDGKIDDAKKILTDVETYFGLTKEGLVMNKESSGSDFLLDSVAQVFAYLTLGGALDKYKKK